MPRATTNKLYRTFVKGLITEAGPLTFPEDATIAESNCVMHLGGWRSRRKGFNIEEGGLAFVGSNSDPSATAVSEFTWKSVNNDPLVNFTVVQVGNRITFCNNAARPMSTTKKVFEIDLNTYSVSVLGMSDSTCQYAQGKGYLFIVSPKIVPIMVEYNPATDTITVDKVFIQIRDFKGVDDGLANDEEPTTLSNLHRYNLQNQGWLDGVNNGTGATIQAYTPYNKYVTKTQAGTGVITTFFTAHSRYPGNNKQWWVARDATTNDFDAALLGKFFAGTGRAPRGHYIIDPFNVDRSAVSGVPGLTIETNVQRPAAVAFSNGRAWFGQGSTIYYSQIIDSKQKAGMCFAEADPTSEDISDLLPTDGGVIEIPEMATVSRIVPMGDGVVCFGVNGVWFIGGGSGGFTATDYSISKVSPTGTDSPNSVVHVQDANTDMIMYWSRVGIIGLQQRMGQFGKVDGAFDTSIMTQTTIQTFYNAIQTKYHPYVKGHYDSSTNTVQWLYNTGACPYLREFNAILNFDLTLKAFYPWELSPSFNAAGPYLVGVVDTVEGTGLRNAFTKYVNSFHVGSESFYSFAEEWDDRFRDWNLYLYQSYLATGYELLEDAMRDKQTMYVYTYLKKTETTFIDTGGIFTGDHPSSLIMQARWDWADSVAANRYSTPIECYRHLKPPIPTGGGGSSFNTGYPIVVTKHKVRGHGKAIQFWFNSSIDKDFVFYGWSVPYSGNTAP